MSTFFSVHFLSLGSFYDENILEKTFIKFNKKFDNVIINDYGKKGNSIFWIEFFDNSMHAFIDDSMHVFEIITLFCDIYDTAVRMEITDESDLYYVSWYKSKEILEIY